MLLDDAIDKPIDDSWAFLKISIKGPNCGFRIKDLPVRISRSKQKGMLNRENEVTSGTHATAYFINEGRKILDVMKCQRTEYEIIAGCLNIYSIKISENVRNSFITSVSPRPGQHLFRQINPHDRLRARRNCPTAKPSITAAQIEDTQAG